MEDLRAMDYNIATYMGLKLAEYERLLPNQEKMPLKWVWKKTERSALFQNR